MSVKSYPLINISIGVFLDVLTYNVIFCKMAFANTLKGFELISSRNIFLPFFTKFLIFPYHEHRTFSFSTDSMFFIALRNETILWHCTVVHNHNMTFDKKHALLVRMLRPVLQLSTLRQILLLEESLREASGRSPIPGDFNSKSPEWGEARLDRRGILVCEMVARNDLIVLNRGRDFTFRRGGGGSIIDLTIAAPRLASRIGDWCVLEVITLSDHQCIEFSIQERSHPVNTERGRR